jgi:hypothetical protein
MNRNTLGSTFGFRRTASSIAWSIRRTSVSLTPSSDTYDR